MLSETQEGLGGLRALFEIYQSNYGMAARPFARKHGYTICVLDEPVYHGHLRFAEKKIDVSRHGSRTNREFVIFHEMAHHTMHDVAPIFAAEWLQEDVANDIEYWCDHFALAMFFAKRGARLMGEKNYRPFLTRGNVAAYDGRDCVTPSRQSAVLSKRVRVLAMKFFEPDTLAYRQCIDLGQSLLCVAKTIRACEEEE